MLALSKRAISIIAAATTQKTPSSKISSSLHFTFSLSSSSMASTTEQTLRESLASKLSAVEIQANTGEVFRQSVVNTLERRLFYIPSFKIYGGVAGLYDYGPPGCAVKSNVLSFWRQVHYQRLTNYLLN
jgi:glycyl-tRNA synthetase